MGIGDFAARLRASIFGEKKKSRLQIYDPAKIQEEKGADLSVTPAENSKDNHSDFNSPEAEQGNRFYTVQAGDTLSVIAENVYGDAAKSKVLLEANKSMLKNPDRIYPGQVLRIPKID